MLKKFLMLSILPLLFAGCAAKFTNLTPKQQIRNAEGLYPVEVAFNSRQQTLRWDSINAQIVVGGDVYPMHRTMLMTNRWEGLIPVRPGANGVTYQYKFDFLQNEFGPKKPNSARSPKFTLHVVE